MNLAMEGVQVDRMHGLIRANAKINYQHFEEGA